MSTVKLLIDAGAFIFFDTLVAPAFIGDRRLLKTGVYYFQYDQALAIIRVSGGMKHFFSITMVYLTTKFENYYDLHHELIEILQNCKFLWPIMVLGQFTLWLP